jgi:hypothetical protein
MAATLEDARTARSPWALITLAIATVQAAMGVTWVGGLFRYVRSADVQQSDVTAFATAWRMVLHGNAHLLYDVGAQQHAQEALRGVPLDDATLLAYVNPPWVAWPTSPLGLLPFRASYLVWFGIQVLLLACAVRALLRTVAAGWSRAERAALVAGTVTCVATLTSLSLGALAVPVLLAAVQLARAVQSDDTRFAGAWLVLLAVKPQLAMLAVAALVGRRCWQVLRDAAVIGGVLAAVSTALCGPGVWTAWLRLLGRFGSAEAQWGVDAHYMWNLRGALARWGAFGSVANDRLATGALVLSALMTVWMASRSRRRTVSPAGVAALVSLTVLTATHCNRQDTLLLVFAAALTYGRYRTGRRGPAIGCALMGFGLAAWAVGNRYDGPVLHPATVLAGVLVAAWAWDARSAAQAGADIGRSPGMDLAAMEPAAAEPSLGHLGTPAEARP